MRVVAFIVSIALAAAATPAAEKPVKKPSKKESLAGIYVFYSEPPFEYQLVGEIQIKVGSMWDRDKMERRIRSRVARAGGNLIILDSSFMRLDEPATAKIVRTPKGKRAHVRVPLRSAYVAGRVATRVDTRPESGDLRLYSLAFDPVWQGVIRTAKQLGWSFATMDTDSRYMRTDPVVTSAAAMQCDGDRVDGWLPAIFTIYVNTFAKQTSVRLEVAFVDRSTGTPTACRSVGAYERAFFDPLDKRLDDLD